jgi:hypothetical protein
MSSSFRSRVALAAVLALAVSAFATSESPQTYLVPNLEISSYYHTFRVLSPLHDREDATTGYIATAEALVGKRTERSQTELRPRVRFQKYPDRSGIDPVDAFLDLQTQYRTLVSNYSLLVNASRQDTFNAEFGQAGTDTSGPEVPPELNDTGIVFLGNTRTEIRAQPSFERRFSERTSFGVLLGYDKVDYEDTAVLTREDYTNWSATFPITRELRPLTSIEVGPYVGRYEAGNNANRTDSAGLNIAWQHSVSEISSTKFTLQAERTKIDDPSLLSGDESQTNWGATLSGYRKGQVSRLDYAIGRYLAASGLGSKTKRAEARLQYSRDLTQRLGFKGAVRGGHEERLGLTDRSRNRNYARSEVSLEWSVTPTLYISGGYRYAWQKYRDFQDAADDNVAFVVFGYRGLDIRRGAVQRRP